MSDLDRVLAMASTEAEPSDFVKLRNAYHVVRSEYRALAESSSRIAAEYLEARRVIDAGPPRPESGFATPRSWKHNDPEVIRWHKASAALNELASKVNP